MNEIIEYKLIEAVGAKRIEAAVNEQIKQGYQPFGDLVKRSIFGSDFCQPMVKRANADFAKGD